MEIHLTQLLINILKLSQAGFQPLPKTLDGQLTYTSMMYTVLIIG